MQSAPLLKGFCLRVGGVVVFNAQGPASESFLRRFFSKSGPCLRGERPRRHQIIQEPLRARRPGIRFGVGAAGGAVYFQGVEGGLLQVVVEGADREFAFAEDVFRAGDVVGGDGEAGG